MDTGYEIKEWNDACFTADFNAPRRKGDVPYREVLDYLRRHGRTDLPTPTDESENP